MSNNDWTNKLRDQLADYQEPVSHDLWAGIESSLAHQNLSGKATAKKVSIRRWSAAAAAVALLGIGGSYVYLHQNANQETRKVATSLAANQATGSSATPASLAAQIKSAELLAAASDTRSPALCSGAALGGSSNQSTGPSATPTLLSADLQSEASSETNHDDLLAEAVSDASAPISAPRKQKAVAASDYESFDFSNSNDFSNSKSHGIDWSMNLYAENVVANSQSSPSRGVMVASAPSSGGQFYDDGVLAPPSDFADKTTFLASASPWLRASRYQKAEHHAPLSVGMQVGVGILPRLTLSTGVVYTRAASDFQPNGVDDYTVRQVLHYVGVPLGVNYRVWSKNGFSTYVMAGGEADFNVKNDTEESGFKEDAKLDRPQFSAKASLGLQYDITPQVGLYMEPGAKYYFDNGSSIENTFKDKKLNFNFQFGLRWNIGK